MTDCSNQKHYTIEMGDSVNPMRNNYTPVAGIEYHTPSYSTYSNYLENGQISQNSSTQKPAEKSHVKVSNLPLKPRKISEDDLRDSEMPLSPIEEQLAKNEESKESLNAIPNSELEKAIKIDQNEEKKVKEKVKKVISDASKGTGKKDVSRQKRYESSTISWNHRRPKSGMGRNGTYNRSIDKSKT